MRAHDLTLAVRSLFHRPGFAAVAILLLALGAGANAAVFSVVRGVLLRPLPFTRPDRLVAVWPGTFVSNQDLHYWREHLRQVQVAGQSPGWMMALVAEGGEPLKVTGARVTDNLFTTLGATAAIGRAIQPGDGPARVVVLADALWRSRFGGDPAILERTIFIDQEPYAVIGVMGRGFEILGPGTDIWVPLPFDPAGNNRASFALALGRLADGATTEAGTQELAAIAPAMRRDLKYDSDWGTTLRLASLQDTIVGDTRPMLLILLGAVGLVLMLAAVNLGTLVLGRSVTRAREMAVRTALGASRRRLLSQLLVEQAVLALVGALAGLALARALLPALSRIPATMPRAATISLDATVFVTVIAVSVTVALVMALVPALVTARPSLQPLLRQATSSETPGRRRLLGALVSAQIALAAMLGIGAGLMIRSLWNLQQVDPGFDPDGVLMLRLQTTSKYRALGTGLPYLEQAIARIRALPGVTAVGAINHPPMSGYSWTTPFRRAGDSIAPSEETPTAGWRFIGWDYFQAMRIPLRSGRTFTSADAMNTAKVVIVNEALARRYFGDAAAAVGRSIITPGSGRPGEETLEIVGVSGDVHHNGVEVTVGPELYKPLAQTFMFPMALVVRSQTPPADLAPAIRRAALEIDPVIPVAELQPYTSLVAGTLGRPRLLGGLLTVFASAGLLLALVGTYGVVAYRVGQREREIGIRVALGARPQAMAWSIVVQGLGHAAAGLALGLPIALSLSRVMRSVVFGVTPRDPFTFVALPLVILAAAVAASYVPARRAARVDPAMTMRAD